MKFFTNKITKMKLSVHIDYLNEATGDKIDIDDYKNLSPLGAFKLANEYFWGREYIKIRITNGSTFLWVFSNLSEFDDDVYIDLLHREKFNVWAFCIMKGVGF